MFRLNPCLPALLLLAIGSMTSGQAPSDWPTYGGDPGGQRHSSLADITPANVNTLRPAWVYHTHALDSARLGHRSAAFESTPILFHGTLYLTTPFDVVIALDPLTGALLTLPQIRELTREMLARQRRWLPQFKRK